MKEPVKPELVSKCCGAKFQIIPDAAGNTGTRACTKCWSPCEAVPVKPVAPEMVRCPKWESCQCPLCDHNLAHTRGFDSCDSGVYSSCPACVPVEPAPEPRQGIKLPLESDYAEAIWQHDADQAILDKAVVESYEAGKAEKNAEIASLEEEITYNENTIIKQHEKIERLKAAKTPTVEAEDIEAILNTKDVWVDCFYTIGDEATGYHKIDNMVLDSSKVASAILALFKGE
jgi:hypothetical protein